MVSKLEKIFYKKIPEFPVGRFDISTRASPPNASRPRTPSAPLAHPQGFNDEKRAREPTLLAFISA